MGLRDDILKSKTLGLKSLDVPEWASEDNPSGTVYVRIMSGSDRDALDLAHYEARAKKGEANHLRGRHVAAVLCDAQGVKLFRPEEAALLGEITSAEVLDRVIEASTMLNAMSAKSHEELVKNSESGQNEPGGSD